MKKNKDDQNTFLDNTEFQRGDRIIYNDEFGTVIWGVRGMPDRIMVVMDAPDGLPKNHPNEKGSMIMLYVDDVKKAEIQ